LTSALAVALVISGATGTGDKARDSAAPRAVPATTGDAVPAAQTGAHATVGAELTSSAAHPAPAKHNLKLVVQPASARVSIDGAPVTAGTIALSPGTHDLRATASGYQPLARSIDAAALGDVLTVRLMRADRRAERTEARKPAEPRASPPRRQIDSPKRPELPSLRSLLEQ
jgi:hypothetical protein